MAAVRNENWPALRVRPSGIYWVGDTISILFSGGLLCLGWGGCGPQEQHLVQETVGAVGVRGHNTSEHPFTSLRRPESEVLFQGQTQACLSQTCPAVQHFQMLKTKELFHPLLHFSHVAPSFSSLFCKANENFHKFKARNFHTWIMMWRLWYWLKKNMRASSSGLVQVSVPVWRLCPWCWSQRSPGGVGRPPDSVYLFFPSVSQNKRRNTLLAFTLIFNSNPEFIHM